MTKLTACAIAGMLAFCLTGCSENAEPAQTPDTAPETESAQAPGTSTATDREVAEESASPSTSPQEINVFENELTFDKQINVSLGENIAGNGFEFTLNNFEVVDEIVPPNPSGVYHYMKKQDGSAYVVLNGTLTNTAGSSYSAGEGGTMNLSNEAILHLAGDDNTYYGGTIWGVEPDGSNFGSIEVQAGESIDFKIISCIPAENANSLEGSKLYWSVDDNFQSAPFTSLSSKLHTNSGGEYVYSITL